MDDEKALFEGHPLFRMLLMQTDPSKVDSLPPQTCSLGEYPEVDEMLLMCIEEVMSANRQTELIIGDCERRAHSIASSGLQEFNSIEASLPSQMSSAGGGSAGPGEGSSAGPAHGLPVTRLSAHDRLPGSAVEAMRTWLFDNVEHPYPSKEEKRELAEQGGIEVEQVSQWFTNARRRILEPMKRISSKSSMKIADFRQHCR